MAFYPQPSAVNNAQGEASESWRLRDVVGLWRRRHTLRPVGLELLLGGGGHNTDASCIYFAFESSVACTVMYELLVAARADIMAPGGGGGVPLRSRPRVPLPPDVITGAHIEAATRAWQCRELDNFGYDSVVCRGAVEAPWRRVCRTEWQVDIPKTPKMTPPRSPNYLPCENSC